MVKGDIYSPERLMSYRLAVSAIEKIAFTGGPTDREKNRILSILRKRYGFDKKSVFINNA